MRNDMKLQRSFTNVKQDMAQMYSYIQAMHSRVGELEDAHTRLISAMTVMSEIVASSQRRQLCSHKAKAKKITRRSRLVASKTGSKIHKESCIYAMNIKAVKKIEFSSKAAAEKAKYKLCRCVK